MTTELLNGRYRLDAAPGPASTLPAHDLLLDREVRLELLPAAARAGNGGWD